MTNLILSPHGVQPRVAPHVLEQFPAFYRDYGPGFIRFVEAYFEWMDGETRPVGESRRYLSNKDIDTTVDRFLIHFKNKYLPDIQLETESNVRFMVKHSLDLYRSRGTPRAVDLLFRLVFGRGASVYYPWRDLFRASDGQWTRPQYIEVKGRGDLARFVGRDLRGMTSGASAFCERVVRKKTRSRVVDLMFVSSIEGAFVTGEVINVSGDLPFAATECPVMIGSLTSLRVREGGVNFVPGDLVAVESGSGVGAAARVTAVANVTGIVEFDLVRGGYGFAANSSVLVANATVTLQNVVPGGPSNPQGWFDAFERLVQPMAIITYESANGSFELGDNVYSYHANGDQKGLGRVLVVSETNATHGLIRASVLSGNLDAAAIYTYSNAVGADVPVSGGYVDFTSSGNVVSESVRTELTLDGVSGVFVPGERISGAANTVVVSWTESDSVPARGSLVVRRGRPFAAAQTVSGEVSGAVGVVSSVSFSVGLEDLTGLIQVDANAPVRGATSNVAATVAAVSEGNAAAFTISSDLLYPETIPVGNDLLADYLSMDLANTGYGFPDMPTANLSTVIADAVNTYSLVIGKVASIVRTNPGADYDADPLVRIYERRVATAGLRDYKVTFVNATSSFSVGEVVTQSATGARGLVVSANGSTLVMERLKVFGSFVPTVNSTTRIVGSDTGASAEALYVEMHDLVEPRDVSGHILGLNAEVETDVVSGNGSVVELSVIDSGYGYAAGDVVTINGTTGNGVLASAVVELGTSGKGAGYYKRRGGFLSDQKMLYDGDYWQEFSYEVRSAVNFPRYRDMLLSLLHVAGTKAFGAFHHVGVADASADRDPAEITAGIDEAELYPPALGGASFHVPVVAGPVTAPLVGSAFVAHDFVVTAVSNIDLFVDADNFHGPVVDQD